MNADAGTQTCLQLDESVLRIWRRAQGLFLGSLLGMCVSPMLGRIGGVPNWGTLGLLALFLTGFIGSFVLISRIRCPGCSGRLFLRLAPSWYRTPPSEQKGSVRCSHCHSLVNVSG